MGASAGCCQSATLVRHREKITKEGPLVPRTLSTKVPEEFRSVNTYKELYTEKSKMAKTSKVLNIQDKESFAPYVCRRMPLQGMPQKSIKDLVKHCFNLSNLEHPHICKFVEAFQDARDLLLVYEKADTTTIFDYVKEQGKMTEDHAADYLRQATMALNVAHQSGLYHGRLMPSKVLVAFRDESLDEPDATAQLKICDWGQTYILKPDAISAIKQPGDEDENGSPRGQKREAARPTRDPKMPDLMKYCAPPELVNDELMEGVEAGTYPKDVACGRADIWALGAIMFHMLTGSPPYAASKSKEAIIKNIQNDVVDFSGKAWEKLSPNCRDAIEMMLKVNDSLRITASRLLQHPWIKVAKATFPKKRMIQLLRNMHENIDHCEFTRFVLRVVSEQLPVDSKQVEAVEDAFRCLDSNGDAVLSTEELTKGLKKYLELDEKDLKAMFAAIDRDGSGTLNVQEFVAATMDQRRCLNTAVLWQAFNAFDQDQSGSVEFDEIVRVVKEVEGNALGKERVEALCKEIRHDLDLVTNGTEKSMDLDQFMYIMQNDTPSMKQAMRKDFYRIAWDRCGVDCYDIRHQPPDTTWKHFKGGRTGADPRRGNVWKKKKTTLTKPLKKEEPEVTGTKERTESSASAGS